MDASKLMSTSDYSLFKEPEFSQCVHSGSVRVLAESMRRHGFLSAYPILVSKDEAGTLKIESGRHRLAAAKKLGIPVYYMTTSNYIQEIKKMSAPKLIKTSDYSLFEICQFNRDVSKIKYLLESMKKHGFLPSYPLHVSKNGTAILKVKAGHHRLTAAQQLGIPVYYVISNDDATIHELEAATTAWTQRDYLNSFVKCGEQDYIIVKEFHERTKIPLGCCISLLAGESVVSSNHYNRFKRGIYKVLDRAYAEKVADIVTHCVEVGVAANNSRFISALSRCCRVSQFDPKQFNAKVSAHSHLVTPQRSGHEQMALMEHVYNYKSLNKIPLVFLTDQAMAKRNRALINKPGEKGSVTE